MLLDNFSYTQFSKKIVLDWTNCREVVKQCNWEDMINKQKKPITSADFHSFSELKAE